MNVRIHTLGNEPTELPQLWPELEAASLPESLQRRPLDGLQHSALEPWNLAAAQGRLVELLTGLNSASLTLVAQWILEAQTAGEPCAWIGEASSCFDAEDMAAVGVDLAALAVIRARGVLSTLRSAELLVRSGGFGVVVMELGMGGRVPLAALAKLSRLAQLHGVALVALRALPATGETLGPLVSLRLSTHREPGLQSEGRVSVEVIKDKRSGMRSRSERVFLGLPGV